MLFCDNKINKCKKQSKNQDGFPLILWIFGQSMKIHLRKWLMMIWMCIQHKCIQNILRISTVPFLYHHFSKDISTWITSPAILWGTFANLRYLSSYRFSRAPSNKLTWSKIKIFAKEDFGILFNKKLREYISFSAFHLRLMTSRCVNTVFC